jgi:hypothetical protein
MIFPIITSDRKMSCTNTNTELPSGFSCTPPQGAGDGTNGFHPILHDSSELSNYDTQYSGYGTYSMFNAPTPYRNTGYTGMEYSYLSSHGANPYYGYNPNYNPNYFHPQPPLRWNIPGNIGYDANQFQTSYSNAMGNSTSNDIPSFNALSAYEYTPNSHATFPDALHVNKNSTSASLSTHDNTSQNGSSSGDAASLSVQNGFSSGDATPLSVQSGSSSGDAASLSVREDLSSGGAESRSVQLQPQQPLSKVAENTSSGNQDLLPPSHTINPPSQPDSPPVTTASLSIRKNSLSFSGADSRSIQVQPQQPLSKVAENVSSGNQDPLPPSHTINPPSQHDSPPVTTGSPETPLTLSSAASPKFKLTTFQSSHRHDSPLATGTASASVESSASHVFGLDMNPLATGTSVEPKRKGKGKGKKPKCAKKKPASGSGKY